MKPDELHTPQQAGAEIEVTSEMIEAGKLFVWERTEAYLQPDIAVYFTNLYRVMELARQERRAEVRQLLHEEQGSAQS